MTATRTCPVCGYTGTYATQPMADARHARHSCAKHTRSAAAAAARAARRAAQPCRHPQARHTHGTRAAYVLDRCRCQPCTTANALASQHDRRDRAYGRDRDADSGPVRAHLLKLRADGIGLRRLAALTGVSVTQLRRLTSTDPAQVPPRVRATTAAAVLGVQDSQSNLAGRVRVDARPTQGRLRDLLRRGWPTHQIAAELGVLPFNLTRALGNATVTLATERRVRDLHARWTRLTPRQAAAQQRHAELTRRPRRPVDARGSRRRLQALMRLGWEPTALANHLGVRASRFDQLLHAERITFLTASQIDALFERIGHSGPPEPDPAAAAAADTAREHARQQGWLAPLAWDDIDDDPDPGPSPPQPQPGSATHRPARRNSRDFDATDDTDATDGIDGIDDIDEVAVERSVAGALPMAALTPAEQDEVVRRLTADGRSLSDIAAAVATTSRTVSRIRIRARAAA